MLSIKNLHASIEDKEILKGINLEVKAGEVHAIMGPNGAGKSTLSSIIAGNENYTVTEGYPRLVHIGRKLVQALGVILLKLRQVEQIGRAHV